MAAVLAFAAMGATPAWASPSSSGTLQGVVTAENHGLALHRVSVTLRSETRPYIEVRSTDRDGLFRFEDVPPGLYSIEAARLGYEESVLSPILVLPGRELTEQVVLEPVGPEPAPAPAPRTS